MHKKKIIFVLVAIVVIIGYFYRVLRVDPVGWIKCTLAHGSYEKPIGPLGGPVRDSYCVYTYSDGDKACKSSDECEGRCFITNETKIESTGLLLSKVVGGFGRCEKNNRLSGCSPGTIEDPLGWCE